MKFGIDIGHNCPPDTGAVGVKKEDVLTKDVGTRLMQKLSAAGHSVINCTPNTAATVRESLRKLVNTNANLVDIFVSIHFSAFNKIANGTEVFAISNISKAIAQSVLNEVVKLGFKNRGVKNPAFFVIKNTSMPAILVEYCFCDSQTDMNLFDAERMAEAIKVGLIGDSEHTFTSQPGALKITTKTILKPSTQQALELPAETLVNINSGNYQVLDCRYEKRHYWVKFPNQDMGGRDEHFVFDQHGKVEA